MGLPPKLPALDRGKGNPGRKTDAGDSCRGLREGQAPPHKGTAWIQLQAVPSRVTSQNWDGWNWFCQLSGPSRPRGPALEDTEASSQRATAPGVAQSKIRSGCLQRQCPEFKSRLLHLLAVSAHLDKGTQFSYWQDRCPA